MVEHNSSEEQDSEQQGKKMPTDDEIEVGEENNTTEDINLHVGQHAGSFDIEDSEDKNTTVDEPENADEEDVGFDDLFNQQDTEENRETRNETWGNTGLGPDNEQDTVEESNNAEAEETDGTENKGPLETPEDQEETNSDPFDSGDITIDPTEGDEDNHTQEESNETNDESTISDEITEIDPFDDTVFEDENKDETTKVDESTDIGNNQQDTDSERTDTEQETNQQTSQQGIHTPVNPPEVDKTVEVKSISEFGINTAKTFGKVLYYMAAFAFGLTILIIDKLTRVMEWFGAIILLFYLFFIATAILLPWAYGTSGISGRWYLVSQSSIRILPLIAGIFIIGRVEDWIINGGEHYEDESTNRDPLSRL